MTTPNEVPPASAPEPKRSSAVIALLTTACVLLAVLVSVVVWGVLALTGAIDGAVCDLQYTGDTVALALCKS